MEMAATSRSILRAVRTAPALRQARAARRLFATSEKPGSGPKVDKTPSSEQAMPLGPFYEAVLIRPLPIPKVKPEDPPTSSPKSPRSTTKKSPPKKDGDASASATPSAETTKAPQTIPPPESVQEKAKIVFGSKLAGPAERKDRLEAMRNKGTRIAGILVPPHPEEPDNCCMSGCVNCVWDLYRDEMEAWSDATKRAEAALLAQQANVPTDTLQSVRAVKGQPSAASAATSPVSMDDDGGGSETNWAPEAGKQVQGDGKIAKDFWDDGLYKNVPVGIREFMKQEKRLKEKHMREGTVGG